MESGKTCQEEQFLLLTHVCKMLVEYAVQSAQSQAKLSANYEIDFINDRQVFVFVFFLNADILYMYQKNGNLEGNQNME